MHVTDGMWAAHMAPQAESEVFAATGGDRSIALYDLRSSTPIRKLIMQVCGLSGARFFSLHLTCGKRINSFQDACPDAEV